MSGVLSADLHDYDWDSFYELDYDYELQIEYVHSVELLYVSPLRLASEKLE